MKIGILSDIHGNHIALKEVLSDMKNQKVEFLLLLGDYVGYYYHPEKVLELLKPWKKEMIKGNHEVMLEEASKSSKRRKDIRKKYGHGIEFALKRLDVEQIKMLLSMPLTKIVKIDKIRFLICHGSPWDYNLYIYPDSPYEIFEKCYTNDADFVLIGHSHHPFVRQGKIPIINAGSVGQSRSKGGVANWVLFDSITKEIKIINTKFNIDDIIKEVKDNDPSLPYLWEVLSRNN